MLAGLIFIACNVGSGPGSQAVTPSQPPPITAATPAPAPTGSGGAGGTEEAKTGLTPVPADQAARWRGWFQYDEDVTGTSDLDGCVIHAKQHLDGKAICTGSAGDWQCSASGNASYYLSQKIENGAAEDRTDQGEYAGNLTLNAEIYAGDAPNYVIDVGAQVPGRYDGVRFGHEKVSGSDTYVVQASTDVQTFDPAPGVIIFDRDLPVQSPGAIACRDIKSSGTHHLTIKLTASR